MTPEETAQLQLFLDGLVSAKGVSKIPEAEQLIRQALARQPDAGYLLVQRCMLLEQGLAQAKAQIAELEQSRAQPPRSFLQGGYQPGPPPARVANTPAPQYAPPPPAAPAYGAPGYGAPGYGGPGYGAAPPAGGSFGGSFLGQAAATAAGVAGGAFLFEGLEHMFGHSNSGFGNQSFMAPPNENVTVNNYYENQDAQRDDFAADDDSSSDDPSSDDDNPPDDDADFNDDTPADPGDSWT